MKDHFFVAASSLVLASSSLTHLLDTPKTLKEKLTVVEGEKRSLEEIDLGCKIVDLGNKQFTNDDQTRQYRASEVILDVGYSFSVDMWSFKVVTGCMFTSNRTNGYNEDEAVEHEVLSSSSLLF